MNVETHDANVTGQYEDRAGAYVTSSVHAAGEDLDLMARAVAAEGQGHALDVGCGGGHVSFRLAPLVHRIVAHDLTPSMLAAVSVEAERRGIRNIETRQGRAESLPDADATFDIVATRYSAHHWGDLPAGLAEMRRVLKPGGLGLFMDVVSPGDALLDTWLQASSCCATRRTSAIVRSTSGSHSSRRPASLSPSAIAFGCILPSAPGSSECKRRRFSSKASARLRERLQPRLPATSRSSRMAASRSTPRFSSPGQPDSSRQPRPAAGPGSRATRSLRRDRRPRRCCAAASRRHRPPPLRTSLASTPRPWR